MLSRPEDPTLLDQEDNSSFRQKLKARHYSEPAWTGLEPLRTKQGYNRTFIKLIVLCFIFAAIVAAWIMLKLSLPRDVADNYDTQLSCGSSRDEALRLGCHFDVMSFSWLPPQCYDRDLVEEFLARKSWVYYLQPNSTHIEDHVDFEEVVAGSHQKLFVSWEFHKAHCAYMWRKMHRALLSKTPIDDYINSYVHTRHCTEVLLDQSVELDKIEVLIQTKFVNCTTRRTVQG